MKIKPQLLLLIPFYLLGLLALGLYVFFHFAGITNYPLTLNWSESGRIFAAYQVYSGLLSGRPLPWPWLDPSRSILDGLALLVPHRQIWMYRFWISFLFIFLAIATAWVVARRVTTMSPLRQTASRKWVWGALVLWGSLFLLQGPVYYHVLLGVLPVLWLYDGKKPLRAFLAILLGSVWEGLGRVNWFAMPAFVAVMLYLLDEPYQGKRLWIYLRRPLIMLAMGGAASFLTYYAFIKANSYVIPFLDPSMHYAYMAYKFWPNTGYIGLLPQIAWISLAPAAILVAGLWKNWRSIHWLRLILIAGILALFFAGSCLVSIRAGGGYDLHNYDSFMLLLWICSCMFGLRAVTLDKDWTVEWLPLANFSILIGVIAIPVIYLYPSFHMSSISQPSESLATLNHINAAVQSVSTDSRPVLYIDQRQLLVYQKAPSSNLVFPYDKIELMEMAMARNASYGKLFASDISQQKYSLIVSEILQPWPKRFEPAHFERDWYENNVWVNMVSVPVLTYYTPIYVDETAGIAIYAPK